MIDAQENDGVGNGGRDGIGLSAMLVPDLCVGGGGQAVRLLFVAWWGMWLCRREEDLLRWHGEPVLPLLIGHAKKPAGGAGSLYVVIGIKSAWRAV